MGVGKCVLARQAGYVCGQCVYIPAARDAPFAVHSAPRSASASLQRTDRCKEDLPRLGECVPVMCVRVCQWAAAKNQRTRARNSRPTRDRVRLRALATPGSCVYVGVCARALPTLCTTDSGEDRRCEAFAPACTTTLPFVPATGIQASQNRPMPEFRTGGKEQLTGPLETVRWPQDQNRSDARNDRAGQRGELRARLQDFLEGRREHLVGRGRGSHPLLLGLRDARA